MNFIAADIRPGDLIIALEGNNITSFDDFAVIVKAVGRPVRITYGHFFAECNGR